MNNQREAMPILASHAREQLEDNRTDLAVSVAKVTVGALPVIGSLIGEVVSTIIPNQRLERITDFLKILDEKVAGIDADVREAKMRSDEFVDLLEDGMYQAARAMSKERKEYIASLLKNSLKNDDLVHIGEKKLLSLLGELNDVEILLLKYYSLWAPEQREDFTEKHQDISTSSAIYFGASQEEVDRRALSDSYIAKLVQLELLLIRRQIPKKGEPPEFDSETGMLKASLYEITRLGRLLLKYIDLETEEPQSSS